MLCKHALCFIFIVVFAKRFLSTFYFVVLDSLVTAISDEKRKIYGLQFHPEVDLTTNGKQILKTFLHDISGNYVGQNQI